MEKCSSCGEQNARYRLTAATLGGELLDAALLCRDCLMTAAVTDVLTPGANEEVRSEEDEAHERAAARARGNDFEDTDGKDWT